jgi:hypothetical protein
MSKTNIRISLHFGATLEFVSHLDQSMDLFGDSGHIEGFVQDVTYAFGEERRGEVFSISFA